MEGATVEYTALAWASHASLRHLRWILLTDELRWVLTEAHETTTVHLAGDSVSAHRFLSCDIFDSDVTVALCTSHRVVQVLRRSVGSRVLGVRHHTVEQTSLVVVLSLQVVHLHVHSLKFVHEEIFLNLEFLALNGNPSHLFVLID